MDNQDKENFARNVSRVWEEQGWKLSTLSAYTGISLETLRAIKSGGTRPTEHTCMKLCRVLRVRPMEMIV